MEEKTYKMVVGGNITFTDDEVKIKKGSYSYLNISDLNKTTWSCWGIKKLGSVDFKLDTGILVKSDIGIRFEESDFGEMEELYQYISERIEKAEEEAQKDHIFKCNVCGHVFCYTAEDVRNNIKNAKSAVASSAASVATSIFGTRYDMYEQNKMAKNLIDNLVDFGKCPKCNSQNIVEVTEEELKQQSSSNNSSSADEIKKYKELLDMGAITQEEFDKKKKELLNL